MRRCRSISLRRPSEAPNTSAINPKGRVTALVTENGTLTKTAGIAALRGSAFSAGRARAAVGPVRAGAGAEGEQLSHSTVRVAHRAWQAGGAVGGRCPGDRGDEAQGAGDGDGMLRADRTQALEGAVGHGRAQYTICDPYLFTIGELDRRRRGRYEQVAARHGAPVKRMLARPAVQKAVAAEGTQIAVRRGGRRALPCR